MKHVPLHTQRFKSEVTGENTSTKKIWNHFNELGNIAKKKCNG